MKILHTVESYLPAVSGMAEVVRQLSERMAARGHEVVVATGQLPARQSKEIAGVKVAEFAISGNMVNGVTGDVRAYRDFLRHSDFDVVTNFAAQQWATDIMLEVINEVPGKKIFVPTGFSRLTDPRYRHYFARMPVWMNQYDMTVLAGEEYRDAIFARCHDIARKVYIPNGAAADEFLANNALDLLKKLGIPQEHYLLLHVGTHTWLKGHRETMEIFARSAIKNAVLLLVGNCRGGCYPDCLQKSVSMNKSRGFTETGKRIILADLSRQETVAAFKAADLFLFPSAIECSPIVLFESMASNTPFLVTDVGNAREIVAWSNGGLILPTIENNDFDDRRGLLRRSLSSFAVRMGVCRKEGSPLNGLVKADCRKSARLLADVLLDPIRRENLAQSGFSAWRARFTWEKIAAQYEEVYASLVAG